MNEKEEFFRMMRNMQLGKGSILVKIFLKMFVVFVVASMIFGNCIVYVRPHEFGIKQVNIGLRYGIQEKVYNAGFHFIAPFGMQYMHRFPKNVQVFELTNYPETMSKDVRAKKAAHIQTSDGFFVDVDVSVLFHITDPYKLITTIGPGKLYEDNGIIPKVEPKLKETLGEMTTEEFFKSPLRVARAQEAKELLNNELLSKGINVDYVLIRYFKYSDEIQRNIEEKKLKDQLVFTNQSKAKAAGEEALVKKVKEEGEANLKVRLEQGNAYVVKKNAEKDLYVRTKHANGDLLVKLAEAKKTELINNAYQKQGSDKMVGLKMAEVLQGINVLVLPTGGPNGFNPLDLEKVLGLFGIDGKGGAQ